MLMRRLLGYYLQEYQVLRRWVVHSPARDGLSCVLVVASHYDYCETYDTKCSYNTY